MPKKTNKRMYLTTLTAKTLLILATVGIISSSQPLTSMAQHGYSPVDVANTVGDITLDSLLLKVSFRNALAAGEFGSDHFTDPDGMRALYEEKGNMPFWLGESFSHPRIEALLNVFQDSWKHGLNPEHYHATEIRRLLRHPLQDEQAKLELLVSDAVIRYGEDMTGMRIDPEAIRQNPDYWRKPMRGYDVLEKVVDAEDPAAALESLTPKGRLYASLQDELETLVTKTTDYDYLLPIEVNSNYFKPGQNSPAIPKLRERLGLQYDPSYGPETKYDDPLAAEVMKFQAEHGLEPDGILGPNTMALINRTHKDMIEQVIANLERLRWLDQDRPDRYVLVNIPSATVWGVEHGQVKLEMPVVVGMSYRPTKSFKTEITGVRFNPTWTVPLRLKWEDILPKVKEDVSYLDDKGIELFKGYGKNAISLDPHAINWDKMTWQELAKIRMVQVPGDHNALGRIRVLMPNPYNIYMHDTNHKEYFARTARNYSSGCIRLSRPKDMARFIMRAKNDWSDSKMNEYLADNITHDIEVDEKMPVYILYQTMWLDNEGKLVFGHDVYKQDRKLIKALANIDGYYIPPVPSALLAKADHPEDRDSLASSR